MGLKDPELLPKILEGPRTFVTFDREIAYENVAFIPTCHPGIIIVRDQASLMTLTVKRARAILANFKDQLPEWHKLDWNNAVVEIDASAAQIFVVDGDQVRSKVIVDFSDPDWVSTFTQKLVQISKHRCGLLSHGSPS